MKPQDRFTLNAQERNSPLWKRLVAHYEKKLSSMRVRNDGPLDNDQTLILRGRINEVKAILSINDAMPMPSRNE